MQVECADDVRANEATILQSVIFGRTLFDYNLYYRDGNASSPAIVAEGGMSLAPQKKVIFDTIINAFFEKRYVEFFGIQSVRLNIITSGTGQIGVFRANSFGRQRIDVIDVQGGFKETSIDIPLQFLSKEHAGRLYFELSSTSGECVLHSGCWSCSEPVVAEPVIDIVICTFNNPGDTIQNVSRILEEASGLPELNSIIVVDQGHENVRDHKNFASLSGHPHFSKVKLVSQVNLGGSGGFTRGMIESLSGKISTHILLLDDDIVIDPRVIARVASLYKIARSPFIFGGLMMDLFRPTSLAAHAEVFDYQVGSCRTLPPVGVNCKAGATLDSLMEPAFPNYNAWWFCCIPSALIAEHGLPLPFFVRTDDAEFGTRLTSMGTKIFQAPGVFVWHRPFDAKPSA